MAHYAEMLNANHPDDSTVKVPAVHPWAAFPSCRACGLSVGLGIPIVRWIVGLYHGRVQSYSHCVGDHNSTIKMHIPGMMLTEAEIPVECFGIFTEHLHLACNRCGYRWLMECAPRSRPDSFWRDFGNFMKWMLLALGAGALVLLLIANLIGH